MATYPGSTRVDTCIDDTKRINELREALGLPSEAETVRTAIEIAHQVVIQGPVDGKCEYCGHHIPPRDEQPSDHRIGCVRRRRLEVRQRHGGEG